MKNQNDYEIRHRIVIAIREHPYLDNQQKLADYARVSEKDLPKYLQELGINPDTLRYDHTLKNKRIKNYGLDQVRQILEDDLEKNITTPIRHIAKRIKISSTETERLYKRLVKDECPAALERKRIISERFEEAKAFKKRTVEYALQYIEDHGHPSSILDMSAELDCPKKKLTDLLRHEMRRDKSLPKLYSTQAHPKLTVAERKKLVLDTWKEDTFATDTEIAAKTGMSSMGVSRIIAGFKENLREVNKEDFALAFAFASKEIMVLIQKVDEKLELLEGTARGATLIEQKARLIDLFIKLYRLDKKETNIVAGGDIFIQKENRDSAFENLFNYMKVKDELNINVQKQLPHHATADST